MYYFQKKVIFLQGMKKLLITYEKNVLPLRKTTVVLHVLKINQLK